MSKNPFSKIAAPIKPDPRTMPLSDYSKYQSFEMERFAASLRSYKKSLIYLGGTLVLSLVSMHFFNKLAHREVFGADNRGGVYLNLKTHHDEDHYAYNREFQRMHVLGEGKLGDLPQHSKQLIKDLGVNLTQSGNPHVAKRAPHEKFY